MSSKYLRVGLEAIEQQPRETYETRKELRLVGAEVVMTRRKAFKTDWELDVARADNILDLEISELSVEAELLNNSCVFARRQARVLELVSKHGAWDITLQGPTVLRFGTSDYHLARSKDECSSLRLADAHDDSSETLWIVLRISCVKRDGLQIETAIEIDRGNDISSNTPLSLKINKRHNKAYTHCKVGTATKSIIDAYNELHCKALT